MSRLPEENRAAQVNPTRARDRLIRLTVGVTPPAGTTAIAAIAALVGRQLGVAVRADESQILSTIVGRISVDMVQDEDERRALPHARSAADCAAARLSLGKKRANVVSATAVDPCLTGFEPEFCSGITPGQRLAGGAAINLLTALGK